MLEWLKTLLKDAYTDDIDKAVSAEIGKGFVSKADFNTKGESVKALEKQLAERDTQLETLKNTSGDVEALKTQITTLQEENKAQAKAHADEIKSMKVNAAVESALSTAGAKNLKAAMALLQLDNAELSDDGTVKGLAEQIAGLTKDETTAFLFGKQSTGTFKGLTPADGENNPSGGGKAPKDMTYDELCGYLSEHPNAQLT